MKKFRLLFAALAVLCFVAFTSCGDDKKKDEKNKTNDKEQVTNDQDQDDIDPPTDPEVEIIEVDTDTIIDGEVMIEEDGEMENEEVTEVE